MSENAMLNADQQHLRALDHANRVRFARADCKRRIAAGELAVGEVVLSCPWHVHSMSISDLVMSQKRWGSARCRRLLNSIGVRENKEVGALTERQRVALAARLGADDRAASSRAQSPVAAAHVLTAA